MEEVVMEEGTKKSFPIKKTIITVVVIAVILALVIGIFNVSSKKETSALFYYYI